MGDKKTQEQGKVTVTAHYLSGVSTHEEEKLEVRVFETSPARVRASYGLTIGTSKKFEFVRLDCAVELPVYVEEVEAGIERAFQLAEKRISGEVDTAKRTL